MTHNPPTRQLDLDAIQARIAAATPGPWAESGIGDYGWGVGSPAEHIVEADDSEQGRANAAFIAHARTDVERLVAEVRRLRALADRTRALALLEAANRYAKLADENEAYDGEQGDLDERARIQHETVRDVAAGLRHLADEADPMVGSLARDGFGPDEIADTLARPAVRPAVETGA